MKKLSIIILLALSGAVYGEVILVVGDSLSAAYNIPRDAGWVNLLQQRLAEEHGDRYRVVNASISGDTSAGGLARLPGLLASQQPDVVILELGANDGLRALPLGVLRANLQRMIALSRAAGAEVLLVNVHLPPSYGKFFNEKFQGVFLGLQQDNDLPMVPFGFAQLGDLDLVQADGLHPTAAAQPLILDLVLPQVARLLAGDATVAAEPAAPEP